MFKALILGLLILCTSAFPTASCDLENATIARSLSIITQNATTLPFNGHLYTISKNQTHIHVNSTDDNRPQPCDIKVDADEDLIVDRFEYVATEREIFIVGVRSIGENREYEYTILRVDPRACSYRSASINETSDERGYYFLPRLVRLEAGVDVFFPSLQKCSPCRLDDEGSRTNESTSQLPRETHRPADPFLVAFVEPINSYLYVYNMQGVLLYEQEAAIKLLDGVDFSTIARRKVNHSVHAISQQKKSIWHLGICSKIQEDVLSPDNFYAEIRCDRLNAFLDVLNTIRIPVNPNYSPISRISYEFDKNGRSYVSFAEDTELRLYIHDAHGKLVKAFDLGEVDEKFKNYPNYDPDFYSPYDHWDVRGFLHGNQYCVVVEQVMTDYPAPLNDVKCFDINK